MVVIQVDVISDIVCIWCFIGKRTLEKAISLYQKTYPDGKNDIFTVKWRPHYLNQNSDAQSVDKNELSRRKFEGVSPEKWAAMDNRVHQIGRSVGIQFKFEGKIGSTRKAHQMIHMSQLSADPQTQDALVEELFQAYHEKAMDISDPNVLKRIAVDAGLDARQVDEWMNSGLGQDNMDEEAHKNRKFVTTGVPTFIIQGRYRVDGSQDLQEFFDAFVKVKQCMQEV